MPYAEGRIFHDADSHLMETQGWLVSYADPKIRERILPITLDDEKAKLGLVVKVAEDVWGTAS